MTLIGECFMSRRFVLGGIFGCIMFLGWGIGPGAYATTGTSDNQETSIQPTVMPDVIWVENFEIDSADVTDRQGVLGGESRERRPLLRGEGLLHRQQDPASKGRELVDLLSSSLTRELNDRSLPARRLLPGQPLPDKGWLIRGQFLEVDEGNRARRAIIGFGSGETHMEVQVTVTDQGTHPDSPFLLFGTTAESGKMPGAIILMNPYVAAAKFVLSKNASEKDVKHTAGQIAAEIVSYMKRRGLLPQ